MTQYFISGVARGGVHNEIGQALVDRILQAIREKQVFRVVIILPCYPTGGSWRESTYIQYIMKW